MTGICKKCLLRDISPEEYENLILRGLQGLKKEDITDDREKERRLNVCRGCDKLNRGTCLACGCFVEIRAALTRGRCPYKKW